MSKGTSYDGLQASAVPSNTGARHSGTEGRWL